LIHEIYIISTSGSSLYHYSIKETNIDEQMITSLVMAFHAFSDEVFFSRIQKIDLESKRLTFLNADPTFYDTNSKVPQLLGLFISDLTDHPLALQRTLKRVLKEFIKFINISEFRLGKVNKYPEFDKFIVKYLKKSVHPRNILFVLSSILINIFAFYITSYIFYQEGIVEWRDFLALMIGSILLSSSGLCSGTKLQGAFIPLLITFIESPIIMIIFNESGLISFMFAAGSLSIISGFFGGYIAERFWLFKTNKYQYDWKIYIILLISAIIIFAIQITIIFPQLLTNF